MNRSLQGNITEHWPTRHQKIYLRFQNLFREGIKKEFLTVLNVVPQNVYIIVTVRPVVFVKVADCVTKLMKNQANILAAISHIKDLFPTDRAHH